MAQLPALLVALGAFAAAPSSRAATPDDRDDDASATDERAAPGDNEDDDDGWGTGDADDFGDDFGGDLGRGATEPRCPVVLSGSARSAWDLWVERLAYQPWASGRQSIDLAVSYTCAPWRARLAGHAERDLAYLVDRDRYDGPTLDAYEGLIDLREAFVSLTAGGFDATIGWQVVPWGKLELLTPLDVINPRDMREPGLVALEDLRLPVLSTRLGLTASEHRFDLIVVHEAFFGYRSPPLGPFSPFGALVPDELPANAPQLDERRVELRDRPDRFDPAAQQIFLRYGLHGTGVDLAFYGAWALDQLGVASLPPPRDILADGPFEITLDHRRYWMVGHSAAVPVGEVVFHWDVGLFLDRTFTVIEGAEDDAPYLTTRRLHVADVAAGVSWSAPSDTHLGLEVGRLLPLSDAPPLLFHLDAVRVGLRVTQLLLDDDLRLDAIGILHANDAGVVWALVKVEGWYRVAPGLRLGLGYVSYQPSTTQVGMLVGMDTHDRLFARVRWDFSL